MSRMAELADATDADARETGPKPDGEPSLPGAGVLIRNEALKTRHRLAFWTGLLVFLLFVFMLAYAPFHSALTGDPADFSLPGAWRRILLGTGPLAGLFGATVLILLIGSEWSWNTARQNVIDGLSREQWFVGKVLLWGMLGCVFLGGQVALAGGMAAYHTDFGAGPLVRVQDLWMLAGSGLMVLGYLGMGFLTSFLVRSAGSAVGLFFLWIFLEQLVADVLSNYDDWRAEIVRFFPQTLINALGSAEQYDEALRAARVERMVALGRPVPEFFATPTLFALVAAWMAVFVLAAWLVHRRRDL